MNQKTYGSGTGTNETARLVLGIAENGAAHSSREGFVIETYTPEETDSSNIDTEFKVRDGGTIGTVMKFTGSNKNVDFYNHVNLQDDKGLMWGGNDILKHNGTQTYIGDNTAGNIVTITGGHATFAGNVNISGDLNITGDINSTSVTNLDVDDKTITIAKGAADSAAADGAGIVVDGASASLLYDHTGTQWEFNKPVEVKVGSSAITFTEHSNGATIWLDGSNGDMAGGDYFGIHAYGTTDLAFGYAASTKMTLKNTGWFGIGTDDPTFKFEVFDSSNSGTAIGIGNSGTGASRLYIDASNGDFTGSDYMWIGQNNDLSGEIFMPQNAGSFNIKTQPSGTTTTQVSVEQAGHVTFSQDILTDTDGSSDIGKTDKRWANIYADTLYGDGSNLTNLPSPSAPSNMVTTNTTQTISGAKTFSDDVTTSGNIILSGASNEIIKSNGSIRLNIDSDANQSDRIFIVSTGSNSELFRVDESGNGTFTGDINLGTGKSVYISGTSGLRLLHDGTDGHVITSTGDLKINNSAQNKDIIFRGNDAGSSFTALTLDMSEAGNATFSGKVRVQGDPPITPNTNFDDLVITDSAHAGMSIFSGGTDKHGAIYFGDDDGNNIGQIKYLHNNDTMTFTTAAGSASLTLSSGSDATFAGNITNSGTITSNGTGTSKFGGDVRMLSGTNGTTAKIIFKRTDNSSVATYIRTDDYWNEYSSHQNEGHKFVDSNSSGTVQNVLLQLNGDSSTSGNGALSATFGGDVFIGDNKKLHGGRVHPRSVYSTANTNGFLIATDVASNAYAMIQGEIDLIQFNSSTKQRIEFSATLNNNGTVFNSKGTADIDITIKLFVYNSKWYVHVPQATTYMTCTAYISKANAYVGDDDANNSITNLTSATVPSSGVSGSTDIVCKFSQGDVSFAGNATFAGDVTAGNDASALSVLVNPSYADSNEYLQIHKRQSRDGGIVFRSKPTGGSGQNDWQVVNHATTGDLRFYAYGLSGFALTLDREDGNATFNGSVFVNGDNKQFWVKSADQNIARIIPRGSTGDNVDKGLFSLIASDSGSGQTNIEKVRIDSGGGSWFDGGDVRFGYNVTVDGNLTVEGTTTTLNTQTVEVKDNILQLNTTQGSPDTATATTSGISIYRGDGVAQASLIFDDTDDAWDLTNKLVVASTIASGNINISDGTPILTLIDTSSSATATLKLDGVNLTLQNNGTDGDFTIIGKDGSSNINLLTFDTSEGGVATFSGANTYNKIQSFYSGDYTSGWKFSDYNGGIWYDAGVDDLTVNAGHSNSQILFNSGGALALTLNASQDANFAGKVSSTHVKYFNTSISNSYVRAYFAASNTYQIATAVRLTGTSHGSGHVGNFTADILVNHYQDVFITSKSGAYTQVTLKVSSNNNGDYTLFVKSDSSNAATYYFKVEAISDNVDLTTLPSSTASSNTTHEHTTVFGSNATGTGGTLEHKHGGKLGMSSGYASGKFAVMSNNVHGSYDFYNNGTTYLNGATIVDAAFTQSGGGNSSFSGDVEIHKSGNDTTGKLTISGNNNTGTPGQKTSGTIEHRGEHLKTVITHNGSDVITIGTGTQTALAGNLDIGGTVTMSNSGNIFSDSNFQFLNTGSGAQVAKFKGIQLSASYSGTIPTAGILFGTDTNLYRSEANTLKTDDTLVAASATYTDGIIRSRKTIVSNSTYNVISLNSSRTIDDYGGLNKDYMKIDLVTPGPNTDGGSSAHGFGAFSLKLANNGANTNMTEVLNISAGANATFAGKITNSVNSGTNIEMKKGNGTGAIGFGGTSHQTGLIEGVDGGGLKLYTAGNDVNWGGAWSLNTTWSGQNMTVNGIVETNKIFVAKGQNVTHTASSIKISQENTTKSQIRFYGADTSTAGILEFTGSSSDGSVGGVRLTIGADGKATFANRVSHQGLEMTSGTQVDQYKYFPMTFQLTANTWTDTGIDGSDMSTGTYAMQVYVSDFNVGGGHYYEYYSGMMSWYGQGTNSTKVDEIVVHRAGHAPNNGDVQFRTERHASGVLMLQVKHNLSYTGALDDSNGGKIFRFKFRRLL